MDVGTLLSVVQILLNALNCSELTEVWSMWDYKSDLDELINVVVTIKKVLLDAEAKYDQLSLETLQYIEELSFALYDADDLIDEFVTLAKQQQGKFAKKVRLFFSRYNQLGVSYSMSQGVKKIMTKLDSIATRHSKFGLSLDHNPIRKRRVETCSYTDSVIIGRDEDLENIVGMLLDSDVSSLSIVGMGGMGKTALAQLVYNHEKIRSEFPLRLWTCVSDDDKSNLDVKAILAQILESALGQKFNENSMEVVVKRVRKVLLGKRFLIVLDDLWTESRDELQKLFGHLVGGKVGSQIVVTTRSKETAKIVGNGLSYELKGLSDDDSWHLFKLIAFDQMVDLESPNDVFIDKINIGKDIIKLCVNVPLAIRLIGSLLYGQDKRKWLEVHKVGLANLSEGEKGIKPILKLSYHNLESPLKSCFSYCSVFPKDFRINKKKLIRLWIAQGYVVPFAKDQSVQDASEEYFLILLRRCFFQDIWMNGEEIYSFKLHELMHDVALEVSKKEICPASPSTMDMDKIVRHISLTKEQHANFGHINPHIRTYLYVDPYTRCPASASVLAVARLANCRRLRTLDLSGLQVKTLPATMGKFIHLRYLNLYNNDMEVLPNSITQVYNLRTLDLTCCSRLKELPKNFSNLGNLEAVILLGCFSLAFMPSGMSKLNNLYELSMFVVGVRAPSSKQYGELESLKALNKLKGRIKIVIHFPISDVLVTHNTIKEGGYLIDKEQLDTIYFDCHHEESSEGATDFEEELLGALQPHGNLKNLSLTGYQGMRMPRWAIEDNLTSFFPKLVQFNLYGCCELECLPSLGKLQNLKSLYLSNLVKLEYMETPPETISEHGKASGEGLQFFPRLERLTLRDLPKLKEWCGKSGERMGGDDSITRHQPYQLSFVCSKLTNLSISSCCNLTSFLQCPNIETLFLFDFNERLRIISNTTSSLKLRRVEIDNVAWLQSSLSTESFQFLTDLELHEDKEVKCLGDYGRIFRACSSSLRKLTIWDCSKLRSVSEGLAYLTALEMLTLYSLSILNLADEGIEKDVECDGMPWGALCHTLQYLEICNCKELQTFPKWMRKLTSLQQLVIEDCSEELYERCQSPNGEDWPNIQHIRDIKCSRGKARRQQDLTNDTEYIGP